MQTDQIRRRDDGSIDAEFYRARAMALHVEDRRDILHKAGRLARAVITSLRMVRLRHRKTLEPKTEIG